MISRLTASAATFAVLATASLTFAAGSHQQAPIAQPAARTAAQEARVVQFETVVITGKRIAHDAAESR
jgi:hypothetical protein